MKYILFYIFLFIIFIFILLDYFLKNKNLEKFNNNKDKTVIFYCYFENEETKKNLSFFIKNGLINNNNYKYIFIINNKLLTVEIPNYNNIDLIIRDENNYDLYTYKQIINNLLEKNKNYFDDYKYFYFINSSCVGPFISPIIEENYITIINKKIDKYDLIGPIIEFPNDTLGYSLLNINKNKNIPFLHTYMFAVNKTGFLLLINLFKDLTNDKKDNLDMERKISSYFLLNNYKIYTLLSRFKNIDINNEDNWNYNKWNINNSPSCYEVPGNYFNMDIDPYEIIFVKNIRNPHNFRSLKHSSISDDLKLKIKNYSEWM